MTNLCMAQASTCLAIQELIRWHLQIKLHMVTSGSPLSNALPEYRHIKQLRLLDTLSVCWGYEDDSKRCEKLAIKTSNKSYWCAMTLK